MSQSLLTGASGLLAHQNKLDVVANNLANLNTTGYKAQRILFSDLLYSTNSPASGASDSRGGTNPREFGFGVSASHSSRNFGQGVLTASGNQFDFAMQGNGFFVLNDGVENYTRAGTFSLDSRGYLVDPATGARVQRYGSTGEGLDGNLAIQKPGNRDIRVPLGTAIAGRQTREASFFGNLPANSTPPQSHVMGSVTAFLTAGDVPATATTLLSALTTNNQPYALGDSLELAGYNVDGSPITASLAVDATTTMGDVVNFYNSVLNGATAQLNAAGKIIVTADNVGATNLRLELSDGTGNTGGTEWSDHSFIDQIKGKNGDVAETTMQVFDSRGTPHTLNVSFQKTDVNTWDATFNLVDGTGAMVDSIIQRIDFDENGKFEAQRGTGTGDGNISLKFKTLAQVQEIDFKLEGLTHLATVFSASFEQDGYSPGNLVSVTTNTQGGLEGVASNGVRVPIAQLAIASFINVGGLAAKGQNYFQESANSGRAQIGVGQFGANGQVRGGQLESSNVDVALEFTQLIVAQRGFSANARTITVASEVLQELANLIR